MNNSLESRFNKEIRNLYIRSKDEEGYQASYFLNMLENYGSVLTAKKLLIAKEAQSGFLKLMEKGRKDLTVEALILKDEYADLFTPEEIKAAKERIRNYQVNKKNVK